MWPGSLRPVTWLIPRLSCTAFSMNTVRTLSAQGDTDVVNEMVQFARATCQENPQQALDVLQTGLAHQDGYARNRLYLAMAEVETGRSNWAAVAEHAGKVALSVTQTGMPTSAAQAQAEAFAVWVRSLLVQGNDHPARLLAEQVVEQTPSWFAESDPTAHLLGQVQATTSLWTAQRAMGDYTESEGSREKAFGLINDAELSSHDGPASAIAVATPIKLAASEFLAVGLTAEAGEWFKEADTAAQLALTGSDDTGLQPLSATKELAADILLGQAQVASAQKAWEEAEQYLSKALSIMEQAYGEAGQHPTVGIVVGMLGHLYARSKRITLAEGLHRRAVKLLQLDVGSPGQNTALCVHSSLAAAAAWRYAQLLTVLPKRETEAELWRSCAERYHEQSGKAKQYIDHSALKDDLGPLDLLKGHESTSDGMVIDLVLRRALPCVRFDQE